MRTENHYCVVELASLIWPPAIRIPLKRFRLFVAADATSIATQTVVQFTHAALNAGTVYFSAWGPDCERFHDIVDEVVVSDQIGDRLFTGPNEGDTIMTTWHEDETLDQAYDFFTTSGIPTAGFEADSDYWLAVCVDSPEWAATIRRQLELTKSRQ